MPLGEARDTHGERVKRHFRGWELRLLCVLIRFDWSCVCMKSGLRCFHGQCLMGKAFDSAFWFGSGIDTQWYPLRFFNVIMGLLSQPDVYWLALYPVAFPLM